MAVLLAVPAGQGRTADADWQGRIAAAARAADAADGAEARLRALTELIHAEEEGQAELRAEMRALDRRRAALRADLDTRSESTTEVLMAMERLSRTGAPLALLHPEGALAGVRAAMITEEMGNALGRDEADLVGQLRDLQSVRDGLSSTGNSLDKLRDQTATARQELIVAARAGGDLPPAFGSEAAAAAALAGAPTLDDLTARYPGTAGAATMPADLPLPALAIPLPAAQGWQLQTDPGALVTAPAGGDVLYSGPLNGFRLVVLLELAPGHVLVLAGLGTALVATGAVVPRGAPLGLMATGAEIQHTKSAKTAEAAGVLPRDTLYMECREADRPVDPSRWFTVDKDR